MSPSVLLFLGCLLLLNCQSSLACETYNPNGICSSVINYPIQPIFTQSIVEEILVVSLTNLTAYGAKVDPICYQAALQYFCSQNFPRCGLNSLNETVVYPPCESVCQTLLKDCTDIFTLFGAQSSLPVCTADSNPCDTFTTMTSLPSSFQCPSPLIINPTRFENITGCVGYCCIPCPYGNYFYSTGIIEALDKFKIALGVASFFLSLFVALSYILMPEKRVFPSSIILCISIALVLFFINSLMNASGTNSIRCNSPVDMAMPNHNLNELCSAQSSLVIYSILAGVCWYFLLVVNVYMNVVFLSRKLEDYHWFLQPVCWGLPLASVIASQVANKTGYVFGFWCLVELGTWMSAVLMIPLAVPIFASVLLNFHVLGRIAWVARNRNATVINILRIQVRFFIFVMVVLFIFLFYWIHFMVKVRNLSFSPQDQWLQNWFLCILNGLGQDQCQSITVDHVPEVVQFTIADCLVNSLGFVLMGFFGFKKEIFVFWKSVATGGYFNRVQDKSYSDTTHQSTRTSKVGSQNRTDPDDLEFQAIESRVSRDRGL